MPWVKKTHIALVSPQGWSSRRLEGVCGAAGVGGEAENEIIFIPQYGTARSNPEPPGAQLNSGRSLRCRQFVLAVSRPSWLSRGEPRSWPRAGGSHLPKLSRTCTLHTDGESDSTFAPTDSPLNGGEKKGRQNERIKVMSASGVTNCCHQGFFVFVPLGIHQRSCWNAAELIW